MSRRVVVTGLGMVSPLGIGVKENWDAVCAGKSGIRRVTRFEVHDDFPVKIAGEVEGFRPEDYIDHKEIKKMDTFIHYAVACGKMALEDSGLKITDENARRSVFWWASVCVVCRPSRSTIKFIWIKV